MRVAYLAALGLVAVLPGCASSPVVEAATLLDLALTVPPGQYGFIELTLDEGQRLTFDWEASATARYYAGMDCPGAEPDKWEGANRDVRGHFTGTTHGCNILFVWRDETQPYDVQVRLIGEGRVLRHGTDDPGRFTR